MRANRLDRVILAARARRRLGIVTTGKAYLDVRQALDELGIDARDAAELGLSIYKVALTWPLEPEGIRASPRASSDVLVVEEKRPVVEEQLAALLYNARVRPRLAGKLDARGCALVPDVGELSPGAVVEVLRGWLARARRSGRARAARGAARSDRAAGGPLRLPPSARAARTTPRRSSPRAASRAAASAVTAWRSGCPTRRTLA